METSRRPPKDLGAHSRYLWREVVDRYTLTPCEYEVLHTLCRTADQLNRIDLAIKGLRHLTSNGSQGQLVAHPLLNEHRQHAETVRRLTRQLNLPDSVVVQRKTKTNPARVAHLVRSTKASA